MAGNESIYHKVLAAAQDEEGERFNMNILIDTTRAVFKELEPEISGKDAFIGKIANGIQDFLWLVCPAAKHVFINSILRVFLVVGDEGSAELKERFRGCLEVELLNLERLKQLGLRIYQKLIIDVGMEGAPAFLLTANAVANYFILKKLFFPIVEFKILLHFIIEHEQDISRGPVDEAMDMEAWIRHLLNFSFPELSKAQKPREFYLRKTIDYFYVQSGSGFPVQKCRSPEGENAALTWGELMKEDDWGDKFMVFLKKKSIDPGICESVMELLDTDLFNGDFMTVSFSREQKDLLKELYREFVAWDESRLQSSPVRKITCQPVTGVFSSPFKKEVGMFGEKNMFCKVEGGAPETQDYFCEFEHQRVLQKKMPAGLSKPDFIAG